MKFLHAAAFALAVLLVGATASADTGNCTVSEIIDMARSGYSQSEIDTTCKAMTSSPNCCCAQAFGASSEPIRKGLMDYYLKEGRIYFVWSSADACGFRANSLCVEPSYCGRG